MLREGVGGTAIWNNGLTLSSRAAVEDRCFGCLPMNLSEAGYYDWSMRGIFYNNSSILIRSLAFEDTEHLFRNSFSHQIPSRATAMLILLMNFILMISVIFL